MQTEKIIYHITNWLTNYLETSNQKGFVIGISGGIDSAVVSTLCAKTGFPLLCLEMPIHQEINQVNRATNHIDWLKTNFKNVENQIVDLTQLYDTFEKEVKISEKNEIQQLSLANTRSRLRMTTLYYFAGIRQFIVAGTGNKIEDFGIGFFTKYGDGGVDISPIGDLTKSEVYELARNLNILNEIQKAVPTDGLFGDNRSDEDQIGASYNELEWAMKLFEEGHHSDEFSGREREVFQIFEKRNKANRHKIELIPVCEIPNEWKS
ncbi:MAG: NAD(+) synthase [Weeksellaceae bacterium]|jgi:NAD+ synthase|nr:NAD(+) synthase [Weeksellaceae bacterium]MDX9705323.1 NAD(+) synthase [Weeksellaceae bacterium]